MAITKNKILPVGKGYDKRVNTPTQFKILVHTTNGAKGSRFESEVDFLLKSVNVSAHYIISKSGTVVEILPIEYRAWHAGAVNDVTYNNNNSIGIEMHYTPGEDPDLPQMKDALRSLCRDLMHRTIIKGIDMHRRVAIPKGRKIDPSCFTDEEFDTWRAITQFEKKLCCIKESAVVWTSPDRNHPVATHINTPYISSGIFIDTYCLECARIDSNWFWITNGIGFIEKQNIML